MSRITSIFMFCAVVLILETSAQLPVGHIDGDARLREPAIQDCLKAKPCIITLDYTPTCGSDGKTYSNIRTISCLNECLKPEEKVKIASVGFCTVFA